jgi:hypothetical protein
MTSRTTALLYRCQDLGPTPWVLSRYKGDVFAPKEFATAAAARAYAKERGWSLRRASDCDC